MNGRGVGNARGVGMEFGYLAPVFVPDKVANTTPGYEQRRVLDNLELSCD